MASIYFSDIEVPVPFGSQCGDYMYGIKEKYHDVSFFESNLTGRAFPEAEKNAKTFFMDIDEIMEFYSVDMHECDFTEEYIDRYINYPDAESYIKLKCIMKYFMKHDTEKAYTTALKIVKKDYIDLPYKMAWEVLKTFKDEKTESIFIDYIVSHNKIVNHDKNDVCWDIVTSYWD